MSAAGARAAPRRAPGGEWRPRPAPPPARVGPRGREGALAVRGGGSRGGGSDPGARGRGPCGAPGTSGSFAGRPVNLRREGESAESPTFLGDTSREAAAVVPSGPGARGAKRRDFELGRPGPRGGRAAAPHPADSALGGVCPQEAGDSSAALETTCRGARARGAGKATLRDVPAAPGAEPERRSRARRGRSPGHRGPSTSGHSVS